MVQTTAAMLGAVNNRVCVLPRGVEAPPPFTCSVLMLAGTMKCATFERAEASASALARDLDRCAALDG
jgi:hypothetical protein